jgi:hypothetical protein
VVAQAEAIKAKVATEEMATQAQRMVAQAAFRAKSRRCCAAAVVVFKVGLKAAPAALEAELSTLLLTASCI